MITSAIEKIIEIAPPVKMEINGRPYTDTTLYKVKDPEPDTLNLNTLTGLVDYLKADFDSISETAVIHIQNYDKVRIISNLFGNFEQRKQFVVADLIKTVFPFSQWLDVEDFIIKLQSLFVQDGGDVAKILKIVGNIKESAVRNISDDGITQSVTVKTGIARVEETPVPNPITLKPYRTFLEIDQPESRFVFRMRSTGSNSTPECALFEADGGQWKMESILRIRAWLEAQNLKLPIIA